MRPATRISGSGAMQRPIDAGPRRSPVPRRSRNTVAAILDAAARIFAKHGYARGTTNRIAERAGVSIGSLYEYFPSKDAILIALTEAHIAEAQGMLRETTGELAREPRDLEGTVRAIVTTTVALHEAAPDLHRVFFEQALRSPRIRSLEAAAERRAIAWWERYLRAQREIPVRDPALAATMVFQTIETMTHKVVIHGDGSTPMDRYVEEIVALVVGYLRSPR